MSRKSGIFLASAVAGLAAVCSGVALSQTNDAPLVGILRPGASTSSLQRGQLRSPAAYSVRLTQICSGAMLFDGTHTIGTRAGAIAVARDIRTSGGKRLSRADAVPKPLRTGLLAKRWIRLERRLIELYADDYLRIWYAIERARTREQRAQLPAALRALIDQPHRFERQAAALEAALNVPDCTGGSGPRTAGGPPSSTRPPPA